MVGGQSDCSVFLYVRQISRLISFPCRKLWKGGFPGAPVRRYQVALSRPLSPSLPLSSSLQVPSATSNPHPAGSLPWLIPCFGAPSLFPRARSAPNSIFQATVCHCLWEAFLASLPICWGHAVVHVCEFFGSCLFCHQALSSLRADTLEGLPWLPLCDDPAIAGTWSFPRVLIRAEWTITGLVVSFS